jgi:hypothetical protein
MGTSRLGLVGGAVLALSLVAVLSGCSGVAEPEPASTEPTIEDTPSAPPEAPVDSVADVLFTITANVRAVDGRTVGISMAAHAPIASTDPDAAEIRDEFLDVCGAGNGAQPMTAEYLEEQGSTLMRLEFASNTPDLTFAAPIDLFFGSPYFASSATGAGITPEPGGQECYYGFAWATSGSARGIADFENADGVPDPNQWLYGHYGFAVNPSSGATIEACKVTLTELGLKSGVDDVPGWDPSLAATGVSCGIGYSGE